MRPEECFGGQLKKPRNGISNLFRNLLKLSKDSGLSTCELLERIFDVSTKVRPTSKQKSLSRTS